MLVSLHTALLAAIDSADRSELGKQDGILISFILFQRASAWAPRKERETVGINSIAFVFFLIRSIATLASLAKRRLYLTPFYLMHFNLVTLERRAS